MSLFANNCKGKGVYDPTSYRRVWMGCLSPFIDLLSSWSLMCGHCSSGPTATFFANELCYCPFGLCTFPIPLRVGGWVSLSGWFYLGMYWIGIFAIRSDPNRDVRTITHIDNWVEATTVLHGIFMHIPPHTRIWSPQRDMQKIEIWLIPTACKTCKSWERVTTFFLRMFLCGLHIVLATHIIHCCIARTTEAVLAASSVLPPDNPWDRSVMWTFSQPQTERGKGVRKHCVAAALSRQRCTWQHLVRLTSVAGAGIMLPHAPLSHKEVDDHTNRSLLQPRPRLHPEEVD